MGVIDGGQRRRRRRLRSGKGVRWLIRQVFVAVWWLRVGRMEGLDWTREGEDECAVSTLIARGCSVCSCSVASPRP